ncbi:MAG: O-antigen ligase family protein [Planctomycetota bacterium]
MSPSRMFGKISRGCVLVLLACTPWAFGSVEPWAYLLLVLGVSVALIAWGLRLATRSEDRIARTGAGAFLLLLLALVALQVFPLPRAVVRPLNPLATDGTDRAALISEAISKGAPPDQPAASAAQRAYSLSVCPFSTRRSFLVLAACVAAFFLVSNNVRRWAHMDALCTTVLVTGFLLAVFGLIQKLSGTGKLFWYRTPRFGGVIFGSFVNRNHFANYMTMAMGIALGYLLAHPIGRTGGRVWSLKRGLVSLGERRRSRLLLVAFAVIVMGASVCASLSRAGIVTLFASLGLVAALLGVARGARSPLAVAAVALLVVAAVTWLGWEPLMERFKAVGELTREPFADVRWLLWRDGLDIVRDAPVLGTGLGTFQHVFPIYKTLPIREEFLFAHNDYLQLLVEVGILGALVALLAGVFFLVRASRAFKLASGSAARALLAGAAGSCLAMLLHGTVDFNLHIPSNAFLFAVCAAVVVAAGRLPERDRAAGGRAESARPLDGPGALDRPVDGPTRSRGLRFASRLGLATALAVFGIAGILVSLRALRLETSLAGARLDYERLEDDPGMALAGENLETILSQNALLLRMGPDNVPGLVDLSWYSLRFARRTQDPVVRLRFADAALAASELAVRAAPTDYLPWLRLARSLELVGLSPQADLAYARATELAPSEARRTGTFHLYTGAASPDGGAP